MQNYIDLHYTSGVEQITVKSVFQYDHGHKLRLYGLDSSATVQMHYAILGMKKAMPDIPVYEDGAWVSVVPSVLLAQSSKIQVYIYVSTENAGQTVMQVNIPITARPKPDGYSYTEEELKGLEYVLNQLSAAVQEVESLKQGTETATTDAKTAASAATAAADKANTAAASIDNITTNAQTLSPESEATATVTTLNGAKHINFGIPQGEKGDTGNSGVYMGNEEPTDKNVNVWIETDGSEDIPYNIITAVGLGTDGAQHTWLLYGVMVS